MARNNNIAFIDGQNLHFGTTKCNKCADKFSIKIENMKVADCKCGKAWSIESKKFRIYLRENYGVKEAYYFLGYLNELNTELYNELQIAGFVVQFKEHHSKSKSAKKGNVDTDIVFQMMRSLHDNGSGFDKIVLVSGDGDYCKIVDYLISKKKFEKILFPNGEFRSSLYKKLGNNFAIPLDTPDIKSIIS